ncbi:MAG: hypothetical protein B6D54_02760 [Epsilonproteobacteria bacterium 4484_65]|nr:MAG: hypothetical protein B6D54_02760 [Epsilonproteobacteria bacterium 4484_65]
MIEISNLDFFSESEEKKNRHQIDIFTHLEKKNILNHLNEQRLSRQKNEKIQKERFENKKIYMIQNKQYYKIIDMKRAYYLEVESCKNISYAQSIVLLYTYTFATMTARKGLAKIDKATERILISNDALRVYFKPYALEEER